MNLKKVKKYIGIFVYGLVIWLIALYISKQYFNSRVPIEYKIIDVIGYTNIDNKPTIQYKVLINSHEYLMIVNTAVDNVFYKHISECKYCKKNNNTKLNGFTFSILDGMTTELQDKLKKLKENK